MELKATLKDVKRDILSGGWLLTFNSETKPMDAAELFEKPLRLEAKVWRKKRSLNANAYFHVLVSHLADKIGISRPRCKNTLIFRYGQMMLDDNGNPAQIKTNIPPEKLLEDEYVHCMPVRGACVVADEAVYLVFRGSHTYDTHEMAALINGTVAECNEQGIDTLPPYELERLIGRWKV